jgi:hypothetical protein
MITGKWVLPLIFRLMKFTEKKEEMWIDSYYFENK